LIGLSNGSTMCSVWGARWIYFCLPFVYLLAGMLCWESYHDSSSAVSRCISQRIPPASCNECRDRRFGGLYLLRVKVGRSPEMVDVRLRGQANSTPSPPSRVTSRAFRLVPLSVLSLVVRNSLCNDFVPCVLDLLHRLQLCPDNALSCCTVRRTVRRNSWNANRWGVVCVAKKIYVINLLFGASV